MLLQGKWTSVEYLQRGENHTVFSCLNDVKGDMGSRIRIGGGE